MSKARKPVRGVSIYLIFYSALVIISLIFLLYFSIRYWGNNFPHAYDKSARAWYVAVGITVITVLCQWIEGRFKSILKNYELLKGGNG